MALSLHLLLLALGSTALALLAILGKILLSRSKDRGVTVTRLCVYPIKSCGATELQEAEITRIGFRWDRAFVVVDESTNEFMSQRKLPKMALIQPSVEAKEEQGGEVSVTLRVKSRASPSAEELEESFKLSEVLKMEKVNVKVWKDTIVAARLSDSAAKWFSERLGKSCYLAVTLGEKEHSRLAPKKYQVSPGDQAGAFSDGYPFLLASEESIAMVNARLRMKKEATIEIDRFRPNIVVKGVSEPFGEDMWAWIRIGQIGFRAVKPCSRCVMPTVDQKTGIRNKNNQPSKEMKLFRYFNWVKPETWEVFFGQNLICSQQTGKIRVGDPVSVVCGTSAAGRQSTLMTRIMIFVTKIFCGGRA